MIEKQKQVFNKLIQALQLLAADYKVQIQALPDYVHVPDEIILTFDDVFLFIGELYNEKLITSKQKDALENLNDLLYKLDQNKSFCTLKSLKTSEDWKKVRFGALTILKSFGKKKEKPNIYWVTYVESKPKTKMTSKIFEIDESKVVKGSKVSDKIIKKTETILNKKLPSSFIQWSKTYGQQICIVEGSGNFLTDVLLPNGEKNKIASVAYGSNELREHGWPVNKDFIVFGNDGGENIFAFYTKFKKNGEYPILLVTLDNDKPYVLMATNFINFVNVYVNLEIQRRPIDDEIKELKIANKLVRKYEPEIGKDFARQLVTWDWDYCLLKEIDVKLKKLYS